MSSFDINVLTAQTSNTETAARAGPAKQCRVFAFGTFGGATVKLQVRPVGSTVWFDTGDLTFTANAYADIFLGKNDEFRGTVASASGTTSVSLVVTPLHGAVNA